MPCLSKESFKSPLLKVKRVEIEELGGYLNVRELGAKDLFALQELFGESETTANRDFAFELLSRSLVDDNGNLLFTDAADCKECCNLGVSTIEHIADEVVKVSGIVKEKN